MQKSIRTIVVFLTMVTSLSVALEFSAPGHTAGVRGKLAIGITPTGSIPTSLYAVSDYAVNYLTALDRAEEGNFDTIWVLVRWYEIEQQPGIYDWSVSDATIMPAYERGFEVGVRLIVLLTGNDENGSYVSVPAMPDYVNRDFSSAAFKEAMVNFYRAFAEYYKGKVKYVAVSNSLNTYFEQFPDGKDNFGGFLKAYVEVVDAMHRVAPDMLVMPDLDFGSIYQDRVNSRARFLDPFLATDSDALGFIAYFFEEDIYGKLTSYTSLRKLLDEMDRLRGDKLVYIVETALPTDPELTGDHPLERLQSDYAALLLASLSHCDFIQSLAWFTLYDAINRPDVAWDAKSGNGFFRWDGTPKKAWERWKESTR
jgi:hypothetical protein